MKQDVREKILDMTQSCIRLLGLTDSENQVVTEKIPDMTQSCIRLLGLQTL